MLPAATKMIDRVLLLHLARYSVHKLLLQSENKNEHFAEFLPPSTIDPHINAKLLRSYRTPHQIDLHHDLHVRERNSAAQHPPAGCATAPTP